METAKHISDLLQVQVEKAPEQMRSSTGLKKILPVISQSPVDEEKKMLQLKYASPRIDQMDDRQIKRWSMALLIKVHIITGWVVPAQEEYLNILLDQFEKKLQEDYSMLNTDEIEYAFRKTGTTTIDYGKQMNLNLIDQVLIPYVVSRLELSSTEEKSKVKPEQKIYTDEEILNERRGQIETAYQAMRNGKMPIVHDYFAEVLHEDGFIKKQSDMDQFFVDSLNSQREKIYEPEV